MSKVRELIKKMRRRSSTWSQRRAAELRHLEEEVFPRYLPCTMPDALRALGRGKDARRVEKVLRDSPI